MTPITNSDKTAIRLIRVFWFKICIKFPNPIPDWVVSHAYVIKIMITNASNEGHMVMRKHEDLVYLIGRKFSLRFKFCCFANGKFAKF